MQTSLRVRCRNQRCHSELPAPTDNPHHAFCTPHCHATFYRKRCRVCEEGMRVNRKVHHHHRAEYRKFRLKFDYPGQSPTARTSDARSACAARGETGIKDDRKRRIRVTEADGTWWAIVRPGDSLWAATLVDPADEKLKRAARDNDPENVARALKGRLRSDAAARFELQARERVLRPKTTPLAFGNLSIPEFLRRPPLIERAA